MPNLYCPSCGVGIKYLYQKPSSCSSCDYIFASVSLDSFSSRKKVKKPIDDDDDEDDEEDDDSEEYMKPKLRETSFSNSTQRKLKKIKPFLNVDSMSFEKIGEVVGTDPNAKREKRKAVSKDELRSKIFSPKENNIEDA